MTLRVASNTWHTGRRFDRYRPDEFWIAWARRTPNDFGAPSTLAAGKYMPDITAATRQERLKSGDCYLYLLTDPLQTDTITDPITGLPVVAPRLVGVEGTMPVNTRIDMQVNDSLGAVEVNISQVYSGNFTVQFARAMRADWGFKWSITPV